MNHRCFILLARIVVLLGATAVAMAAAPFNLPNSTVEQNLRFQRTNRTLECDVSQFLTPSITRQDPHPLPVVNIWTTDKQVYIPVGTIIRVRILADGRQYRQIFLTNTEIFSHRSEMTNSVNGSGAMFVATGLPQRNGGWWGRCIATYNTRETPVIWVPTWA
jgi:hypothetical protein